MILAKISSLWLNILKLDLGNFMSNKFDDLPIVLQLQHLAMNQTSDIEELLRKTLAVSVKLGLNEMTAWCQCELKGYSEGAVVPSYRKLKGYLSTGRYSFGGETVLDRMSAEYKSQISQIQLLERIFEIQQYATGSSIEEEMPISQESSADVIRRFGPSSDKLYVFISKAQFGGIVSEIQTQILEWTCELELLDVLGHSFRFSSDEKERAKSITYQTFINGSFQGNAGHIDNSSVSQTNQTEA